MTFLPIADRELRVAARKRSTFWLRIVAALVAGVIGMGFFAITFMGPGIGSAGLGQGLFGALTWLSLAAVLSTGLFLTSDCLSEEKREGTLGFLFLTDLRGYDVVLGKLLATSLRAFYALLAVFPIFAVTLLMGGVTGAQFWKTLLALVNAMFVSVAAGLFVSAISRESQKALAGTLLLLILWVGAGPASDAAFAGLKKHSFDPVLSLSSPGYLFVTAGLWGRTPYWRGLLINQGIAWMLFGLACVLLPRTWQERPAKLSSRAARWAQAWKYGPARTRHALRQRLVERNPVLWLACRERWQAVVLWVLAILLAGGLAAALATNMNWGFWFFWRYLAGMIVLVIYLGIVSQSGRFFVEAQHNGLIELLLATPLTVRQIVQGQWRALIRMFGLPLVLCLVAQLLGSFMAQQQMWSGVASATAAASSRPVTAMGTQATVVTNGTPVTTTRGGAMTASVAGGFTPPNNFVTLGVSAAGTLTMIGDLAALIWFGMWMGMNSKSTHFSTLKTIVFVEIIPWFVVSLVSGMLLSLVMFARFSQATPAAPMQLMLWFPLVYSAITTGLYLIKDLVFLCWARRKLYSEFRERASQTVASLRPALPPLPPRKDSRPVSRSV